MDGNSRYELGSASPDPSFTGSYQNGQRGYLVPSLGRSSSFREGVDNRNFSSAKANSKANASLSGDAPSLSQCLMLDPFPVGDLKYGRTIELRRVLSFTVGNSTEDNSFGPVHMKNSPPAAVEELRRLRGSVSDTCVKATGRAIKLDEHLSKLNRFFEGLPTKKQQRSELFTNERSGGPTLKIGSQIHRNLPEPGNQKSDDRPKNGVLSKRMRTSMADSRPECRNNGVMRQPLIVAKERDMLKDNTANSEMIEEKIRRLPTGGEGWDKQMKRKRSVGAVVSRSVEIGETKRTMHHKLAIDSSLQSSEPTPGFRSGASGGINKLDPVSSPGASTPRQTLKIDQEKSLLTREVHVGSMKERALGKVNVKLNNRDDNHGMCPSPVVKGKASREPRSGSVPSANSPVNIPRVTGTLESWEQPQTLNKMSSVGGVNNRKRSMSVGSTSPPITQWGGQRPQKISRTRRTNLVSVSNNGEMQMEGEGCSPSDFGPRTSIVGLNGSLLSKSAVPENQSLKLKAENVPSPARFSESEESGAAENRTNEKSSGSRDGEEPPVNSGHGFGPSTVPIKKNKIMIKDESGDSVKRQGRSGRASPFFRASVSLTRETMDSMGPNKPLRNAKFSSEKNGSKSGRPLKKISERKSFSRNGPVANGCCPDVSGESEDYHEELLTSANLACSYSGNACSNAFWKTVEALFASIGPEEKSFLSQQMKLAEESCPGLSQGRENGNSFQEQLDAYGHEELTASDSFSHQRNRGTQIDNESRGPLDGKDFVRQLQNSSLYESSDAEKRFNVVTPFYQRVLSALILDEEIEESEETGFGRSRSLINESCCFIDSGNKHMDRLDMYEPVFGTRNQNNGNANVIIPCNGYLDRDRNLTAQDRLCNADLLHRDGENVHSEVEVLVRFSRDDYPQSLHRNNGDTSYYSQYEQIGLEQKLLLELQSVGLFLEAVPALDDKEDEPIAQEVAQLEMELYRQIASKKKCLDKIQKDIQEGKDVERNPEQVAMDILVELAYKKLLETTGKYASKRGIAKVSKQVALAFVKRTLARCRKFEETGVSCFSEPALREIVYASPPRFAETELLLSGASLAVRNAGSSADAFETYDHVSKNGPPFNRGKKKEVLLDDVGGGSGFRASNALGSSGGAKGKRSERDRDRNSSPKSGRLSLGGSKGERKTKSKPKQKMAQLSTPGNNKLTDGTTNNSNPSGSGELANNNGSKRKDVRFLSSDNNNAANESVDFASLDIDGIDDLGVDDGWFNNLDDVDGLQDHDIDSDGLQIPMDDLSEINMF